MKTKNFFAGHRSGGRAERFKKMKTFFKNLMPMLLLVAGLGISPNAWGWNLNAECVYVDNSVAKWGTPQIYIWSGSGSSTNDMVEVKNSDGTSTGYWYHQYEYKNFTGFKFKPKDTWDGSSSEYGEDVTVPTCYGWDGSSWVKTCVGPKNVAIANNSTPTISGSGTKDDPYIVAAGTSVSVKGSADKIDSETTIEYAFDGASSFSTTSSTKTLITSAVAGNTYSSYVTVRTYGRSLTHSREFKTKTIYFKAVTFKLVGDYCGWDISKAQAFDANNEVTISSLPESSSDGANKGFKVVYNDSWDNVYGAYTNPYELKPGSSAYGLLKGSESKNFTSPVNYTNAKFKLSMQTKQGESEPSLHLEFVSATAPSYSIVYKDKNGTDFSGTHADGHPITHTYGTATTLKSASKTGYTFGGWFTNSECTGASVSTLGAEDYKADITLYAKWTAKTYTIYFDVNHDDITPTSKSVTYDATYGTLPQPERIGYNFLGWFTGKTDGTEIKAETVVKITENTTYYAHWERQVIYYPYSFGRYSGNTDAMGKVTSDVAAGSVQAGTHITLTATPEKGFEVEGWYPSAACEGTKLQTGGNTYSFDIGAETSVYVKFAYTDYTVAMKTTTGGTITAPVEVAANSTTNYTTAHYNVAFGITAKENTGYHFTGWTKEGDISFDSTSSLSTTATLTATNNSSTATANFAANTYQVVFNKNDDGATGEMSAQNFTYNEASKALTANNFVKIGYDFQGWAETADGDVKYNDKQSVSNLTTEDGATVQLYAVWAPHAYTITYKDEGNIDYSGENLASLPATHTYDQETELVDGTKTGYEFQGWFTDSLCTEEHIITTIGGKAITTDTTLYAKWQINSYNITYPDDAAQAAGFFTITEAPATAKYQETVTFKAAPIYGYAGSKVSVAAGGVQLSQEGDTYTFVMGAENVTIGVSPSTKRTCYITASCEEDWGSITPSGKSAVTDMFEKHEYTFDMKSGLTFLKWNIANAKCAEGYTERSYPTIEIIATSEDATISPAIMETYTNVTLNFEPTYMGYIKLNGNNIASGTKTDVSTRTTATIEACTNYGYKFVGWTVTNNKVITLTNPDANWQEGKDMNTSHKLAGVTNGGKTVLTAHFVEDTCSGWELGYRVKDAEENTWKEYPLNKRLGETDQHVGYYTVYLTAGWAYALKVKHSSNYYGCPTKDWIIKDNCAGFVLEKDKDYCYMTASAGGDYVFRVDFSDENKPKVTVLYPDAARKITGDQIVYFYSKYNEGVWSNPIFRIGNESYAETRVMTKVPGTTHLWQYRIRDGWCNYKAIQIANNHGYSGTGKASDKKMIYNMGKKGTDTYYISDGTEFLGGGSDITTYKYWEPFGSSKGDYETNYYTCYESTNPNENATRKFNRNVVKPTQVANGTIKVEQWLSDDGSNRELISDYTDYGVSPSRWITITATPEKGYRVQKISVTTAEENGTKTEDYYKGDSWNYVVHKDITNITATFVKIETWSWYVKNDPDWWAKEGKDVHLYYWHHPNEGEDVPYWGWPGQMCTKMDDTKTWYKVELTNAYFDISTWKLNEGEGEGEKPRQTVEYSATEGDFTPEKMNGKYYEIYLKDDKWQVRLVTTDLPTYYRMEIIDGQNTFYSNTVSNTTDIMSFYAGPSVTSVKLQKGTSTGWTSSADLKSQFEKAGVWTAKVAKADGTAITTPEAYTGKYYIRTDESTGKWNDYKQTSNAFTAFTPRTGETFSYYWVATVGKDGSGMVNVKAKIANDYNDNLAGEISNDKNTDEYGNINKATFGSNIRFSYEPKTNAFEREIISGSAGDVYLNIVGENLYSDISCEGGFALNEANYNSKPKESKLADISDWVYEKTVYVKIPNTETAATVELRSLYNNQRTALYKGDVMQKGTSEGVYKIRLTYDFKKNRIITSWSPSSQEIKQSMVVDADIMFLQVEKGDVSQISIAPNTQEQEPIKVSSLDYLLYVLEIEQGGPAFEHYRISLPFDCRISDIYGIGGFDVLWGIQEYDGKTRSEKGWLDEKTNYWRWLTKDETLKAGVGYSITVDKGNLPFKTIEEEVTRTICDPDGTNCKDVTTYENRAALRLYFPSSTKEFTLSRAQNGAEAMQVENWVCNIPGRTVADANWHFMGSTGYNNIKITSFSGSQDVPYYLYVLNADETAYEPVSSVANDFSFRSFKAYMFQFTGTINWAQYTRSEPEIASAPRYSATQHTPLKMKMKVMEEGESVAHAYIELNDNATFGFDQNQDLAWMNSNSVAQVYTESENEPYAANCVPFESAILPMTVKTLHAGDYTLHLEGADKVAVYLIDYQLQTETLISAGDVEVELEKGSSNNRFALRFDVAASPTDSKNAKGETIINDGQKTQKLLINDQIYLINGGRVYNVLGVEE